MQSGDEHVSPKQATSDPMKFEAVNLNAAEFDAASQGSASGSNTPIGPPHRVAPRDERRELFRRLVLQVTAPAVFVGICLLAISLFSLWQLDRARRNLSRVLSQNVVCMQAATQMEQAARRMRFDNLEFLLDGKEETRASIEVSRQEFEVWFQEAKKASETAEEKEILARISSGFTNLQKEMEQVKERFGRQFPPKSFREVVDAHPLNLVVDPCRELAEVNEKYMQHLVTQEAAWSQRVHWIFLVLGFVAPLGAAAVGYNLARRMSKRLLKLQIQIGDAARQLQTGVTDIEVGSSTTIDELDAQMQYVAKRAEDIVRELNRHQRDSMRNQQLAAVGQLAASLAHEIRNPLTSIKMLVEAGLRDSRPRPLSTESLRVVHREVERLEQTVQELLDFARPPKISRSIAPLTSIVDRAVELVQARAKRQRVEIRRSLAQDDQVDVDEGQMRGVLVNLLLNALDALPQGGDIQIESKLDQGQISIKVIDSGPGISTSALDSLFTPFSSTKETGTGLGLSICKRVIEEHQGAIEARNRPHGGAELEIRLPLASTASGANHERMSV